MKLTTLEKVFTEVYALEEHNSDQYVPVKDIYFEGLDYVSIAGETHPLRSAAQQSFANRLGVPIQYLRRCPADIQQINLNYWLASEHNENLFFRFTGNEVRAVFTPRYTPVDNVDILERLRNLRYSLDTPVQFSLDDDFMLLNILDDRQSYHICGDRMTPGISIANSEVGVAALSVSAFALRLICTNGLITTTTVSASYRHISRKIIDEFPKVIEDVSCELKNQRSHLSISLQSPVDDPEATIESFNRQFYLSPEEKEAVAWALPFEYGKTMFNIINVYTKAAQYKNLNSEGRHTLQKVGGAILGMVK